jgi:arginine kinase
VKNEDSGIGAYAGGPETYTLFAPLMDKIIFEYHGLKTTDNHTSDWDVAKLTFPDVLDNSYCVSTRIRVARNLDGIPFGTFVTPE